MNESEARAALQQLGIEHPSNALIENYRRSQQYEVAASPYSAMESTTETPSHTQLEAARAHSHPSSESNLEPILRERGELERPAGRRKAGRPRTVAPWFACVASAMSDGSTPLRAALARCGVHGLTQKELRALYRNTALLAMRREARQKYIREWGVHRSKPARRSCKGCFPLGMSPQLRRIL